MFMYIVILILSCVGFFISFYILTKKKRNKKLVCVIGDDCDKVVRSKYSALFGVQNEILGMCYYTLTGIFAILFLYGVSSFGGISLSFVFLVISGIAALFSFVLICIQLFVIKEWCEYCLASALVSIAIFIFHLI